LERVVVSSGWRREGPVVVRWRCWRWGMRSTREERMGRSRWWWSGW